MNYKILRPSEWDEFQVKGEWLHFPHMHAPIPLSAVVEVYRVTGAAQVDAALPRPQ